MTELETSLYNIVVKNGLPALILGILTIFLIGVLKYFHVFDKVSKENRKPIYLALTYVFTFGLTAIYYAIFKLSFADYVAYSFVVGSVVNLLYPLYENAKIRDFFALIGSFIVKIVAKKQVKAETAKIKEETNQVVQKEVKEQNTQEVNTQSSNNTTEERVI